MSGVSSGIEPVYAFSFKRTDRTGTHIVYHQLYEEWLKEHPDEPVPDYFVSADQLTPEQVRRGKESRNSREPPAAATRPTTMRRHAAAALGTLLLAALTGCADDEHPPPPGTTATG